MGRMTAAPDLSSGIAVGLSLVALCIGVGNLGYPVTNGRLCCNDGIKQITISVCGLNRFRPPHSVAAILTLFLRSRINHQVEQTALRN